MLGEKLKNPDKSSLDDIRLLADLPAAELRGIEQACVWRRFSDHEQIIDRQSKSSDIFFVVEGRVRVVNYSLSGKEITLGRL